MVLEAPLRARGQPEGSPRGTSGCGAGLDNKPPSDEAREGRVGARPLLENSTACRKSVPSNKPPMPGPFWGFGWGFLWLIDIAICQVAVLSRYQIIYGE